MHRLHLFLPSLGSLCEASSRLVEFVPLKTLQPPQQWKVTVHQAH